MAETYYDERKSRWKWVVLLASFFNHIIIWGVAWGAGVFQVIFMEVFSGKAGEVSVIPTLVPACLSFAGPIASALSNWLGERIAVIIGGSLAAAGLIISSFAQSKAMLYITFALIGTGLGIAMVPNICVICFWFKEKSAMATGIAATGLGFGTMLLPPFFRLLVNFYDWRGALLIMGGITLNMIVAGSVYRPIRHLADKETPNPKPEKKKILQLDILLYFPYSCFFVSNMLVIFGLVGFYIHLPAYAKEIGYTNDEAAVFVSICGATTIVGRAASGFIVQKLQIPIVYYATSLAMGGFFVMLTPFAHDTAALSILCVLFGLGSGPFGNLLPIIVTELVGIQNLNDGYGYIIFAEAVGSLMGPPISGTLFDATGRYTASLMTSGGAILLGSLIMYIPVILKMPSLPQSQQTLKENLMVDISKETLVIRERNANSTSSSKPLLQSPISNDMEFTFDEKVPNEEPITRTNVDPPIY